MNHRPLTEEERAQLQKLVDNAGPAIVIRAMAQIVMDNHPCPDQGHEIRNNLLKEANQVLVTWRDEG